MRNFVALQQFIQDLRTQRLRTILTVLGITWGTVAVVVLLAFGVGLEKQNRKNMHGMGDGIVVVWPGQTTKPYKGFPDGRPIRFREEDALLLATEISDIAEISPEFMQHGVPVRVGESVTQPGITGIYPVYGDMRNIIVEPGGRFINDLDLKLRRRVVVLGDEIKRLLFADQPAVGKQVLVGQTPFTVVGVMQKKIQNSSYNTRDQDRIFIPASTLKSVFGQTYLSNILYKPTDPDRSPQVRTAMYEVLGRKHKFDPTDKDALAVWDTNDMDRFLKYFHLGFNIFMMIIGSFTMTVGGIGVANIMYVVVRERTPEIGIKRSVGARRFDILSQIFIETFMIVAFGAALGFGLSIFIIKGLAYLPIKDFVGTPEMSPLVAMTTMGLLAVIAFFAGYFPARKASRLDPVECLR
jgi:putative ABC transport system permease protein